MYLPVARGWFGRQAMWTDPFEAVEDSREEVIFAASQELRALFLRSGSCTGWPWSPGVRLCQFEFLNKDIVAVTTSSVLLRWLMISSTSMEELMKRRRRRVRMEETSWSWSWTRSLTVGDFS